MHRKFVLKEPVRAGLRVGVSILPTLVFSLVRAGVLRDRHDAPASLYGGLIVYAVVNTMLPRIVLGSPPQFDSPHMLSARATPAGSAVDFDC